MLTKVRALSEIEVRLVAREPFAIFFALAFPVLIILLFGAAFGKYDAGAGFRVVDVSVPATIALVAAYLGFMGIPIVLAEYREMGVLKRYRVSPLPLSAILVAHVIAQLVLLAAAIVLVVVVTTAVFGLRFGGNILAFVGILVLCVLALFAVGFALAGYVRTSRGAQGLGSLVYFPLLFTSGAAVPRNQFPGWLEDATEWLPLTRVVESLTDAWTGAALDAPLVISLVGMVVIAAAASLLARKTFRWV